MNTLTYLGDDEYELRCETESQAKYIADDLRKYPDWFRYVGVLSLDRNTIHFMMALDGIPHLQQLAPYDGLKLNARKRRWFAVYVAPGIWETLIMVTPNNKFGIYPGIDKPGHRLHQKEMLGPFATRDELRKCIRGRGKLRGKRR
jgi:hypothetical protein